MSSAVCRELADAETIKAIDGKVANAREQLQLETYRATLTRLRLHTDKNKRLRSFSISEFWRYADEYLTGYRLSSLPDGKRFTQTSVTTGVIPGAVCTGCANEAATQIFRGFGHYPTLMLAPFAIPARALDAGDWLPPMCNTCCMRLTAKREYHHCMQQMFRPLGSIQTLLASFPIELIELCAKYLYAISHIHD